MSAMVVFGRVAGVLGCKCFGGGAGVLGSKINVCRQMSTGQMSGGENVLGVEVRVT